MLNSAGLGRRERHDVWFSARAKYDAKEIERVLRHRCAKTHEDDTRKPSGHRPRRKATPGKHSRPHAPTRDRRGVVPYRPRDRSTGRSQRRHRKAHFADEEENEDYEEGHSSEAEYEEEYDSAEYEDLEEHPSEEYEEEDAQ